MSAFSACRSCPAIEALSNERNFIGVGVGEGLGMMKRFVSAEEHCLEEQHATAVEEVSSGSRVTEDQAAVQDLIEQGDFTIEWGKGEPNVHFWLGEPFSDIVKTTSLRHLLLSELQVAVPLEFFGNPLDFVAPKDWVHAEQVRLLQALLRAYDQWQKGARR